MSRLTKYEKETIINWNQADDECSVYTFDTDLKHRLAEFAKNHPKHCKLMRTTKEGSATYWIDKKRLSVRLTAPYSEERRKAASERAKQSGLKGSSKHD